MHIQSTDDMPKWDRAELIGGLFNGVFLVALCLTIFLDAIERFFDPPVVENPMLVLIVGGIGLTFNILGLFVFHQHDHGDGGHDHEHGVEAEEGHAGHTHDHADHSKHSHDHSNGDSKIAAPKAAHSHDDRRTSVAFLDPKKSDQSYGSISPSHHRHASAASSPRRRARTLSNAENIPVHPRNIRQQIINDARGPDPDMLTDDHEEDESETALADEAGASSERSPLLTGSKARKTSSRSKSRKSSHGAGANGLDVDHKHHNHNVNKYEAKGGHGHSHADMNIRGMFLHVLGDALGNVGVMASALVIWKATGWEQRYYIDPAISLLITLIILKSAIPLVKDTSKPLLQAVPSHISVDDIRDDIETLPGIRSCHHIHVWALTPSKLIATLDVELDFNFEGRNASRYMDLAKEIKSCLHGHGIHSSTIQPEFCTNTHHDHDAPGKLNGQPQTADSSQPLGSHDSRLHGKSTGTAERCGDGTCLLDCKDACKTGKQCCGPATSDGAESHSDHEHR